MWIYIDKDSTKHLAPEGVDWEDKATFNDNNKAQVKEHVGRKLIEQFDLISAVSTYNKDKQDEHSQDSED